MGNDHVLIAVLLCITIVAVFAIKGDISGASVVEIEKLSEPLPIVTTYIPTISQEEIINDQQVLLKMFSFSSILLVGLVVLLANYALRKHNPKI